MSRQGFVFTVAFVLAACGSSGSNAPESSTNAMETNLQGFSSTYNVTALEEKYVMVNLVPAPLDSVWPVLPGVFLELTVEPGTVDQKAHVISNTSFVVHRSLGGVKLSRYVECGRSISGALADQMDITMSLVVQVVADSAQTSKLRTQLVAYGFSQATSGVRVHCSTTGALESHIAKMATDAVARRAKK